MRGVVLVRRLGCYREKAAWFEQMCSIPTERGATCAWAEFASYDPCIVRARPLGSSKFTRRLHTGSLARTRVTSWPKVNMGDRVGVTDGCPGYWRPGKHCCHEGAMRGTMSAGMVLETRGGGCCREDLCRTRRLMEREARRTSAPRPPPQPAPETP
jgi:hypothetical protein